MPDRITSLAELRALTPRERTEALRAGRLDLEALATEQRQPEEERIRKARVRLGIDMPPITDNLPEGA